MPGGRRASKAASVLTPQSPSPRIEEINSDEERSLADASENHSNLTRASPGRRFPTPASSRHSPTSPHTSISSPTAVLQRGNSDPFAAAPINVGPHETEVLNFYYKNVIPIFHRYMEAMGVPIPVGRQKWHDPFTGLQEKGEAYGFLARSAVFMSRECNATDPNALRALTYRNKTSEFLRAQLSSQEYQDFDRGTDRIVLSLFITAVVEESLEVATVHAKLLNYLFQEQSNKGKKVDVDKLFVCLWYEVHRATMSLTRPVFELSGWVSEQLLPVWKEARQELVFLSGSAASNLDDQVYDPQLRNLFSTTREFLEVLTTLKMDPTSVSTPAVVALATYMTMCQCKLVDRYIDAAERLTASDEPEAAIKGVNVKWVACVAAYTSLAAIYWIRHAVKKESVQVGNTSAKVFDAKKRVLPALQNCLTQAETCSGGADFVHNSRVRLWALYVGVMAEYETHGTSMSGWFHSQYINQAQSMGLVRWEDVREVLSNFLYSDAVEPHGSLWLPTIQHSFQDPGG